MRKDKGMTAAERSVTLLVTFCIDAGSNPDSVSLIQQPARMKATLYTWRDWSINFFIDIISHGFLRQQIPIATKITAHLGTPWLQPCYLECVLLGRRGPAEDQLSGVCWAWSFKDVEADNGWQSHRSVDWSGPSKEDKDIPGVSYNSFCMQKLCKFCQKGSRMPWNIRFPSSSSSNLLAFRFPWSSPQKYAVQL